MEAKRSAQGVREQLFPLMFETGRLIKSEITGSDSPLPSFLHMETLRYIEEAQNPTMREIASYLKVAPPTATALIQSFVDEGILDRSTDPDDRRRVRLSLSKKGLRIMDQMKGRKREAFQRIFSCLSDEDCRELSRILTIITRS